MRYIADGDGEIFETAEQCEAHERALMELDNKLGDIEVFLEETKKDNPDRSKAMYRRVIREFKIWEHGRTPAQD